MKGDYDLNVLFRVCVCVCVSVKSKSLKSVGFVTPGSFKNIKFPMFMSYFENDECSNLLG